MMLSLPQGTYAEEKANLLHRGDVRFGRLSFMAYRGVGRLAPERFELRPPRAVGLGFESSDDVGLLVFVASLASTCARLSSLPSAGLRRHQPLRPSASISPFSPSFCRTQDPIFEVQHEL
jgi:hypothetical protein